MTKKLSGCSSPPLIISSVFWILLSMHSILQGAEVRGAQSGRWTISGSPYIVTGNIVIPENATLTIEPGVIIKFAGYYSFKVSGTLRALGSPASRIVFTSVDDSEFNDSSGVITNPATVNDWVGIEFTDSSNDEQCRFENCVIRYCTSPLVLTQASPKKLESITISNCSSKFANLNGVRIPIQGGVEQDYIIKDAAYQAAAPAAASLDDSTTAPPTVEPTDTSFANGSGSETSTTATTAMLQGVVTDAATNVSLSGANVAVISVDGKITKGAASGANGVFEFQNLAPGLYAVTVSYIGYAEKTVEDVVLAAGEFKTLDILLTHAGIEFNPITITASRRPEKIFDAPAAVSVINASQIQSRSTLTTVEHLKAMPAVDFAGAGINQSLVALRGFNDVFTGALLPLTDYRLARLPALRFNAFNLIPTTNEDIERIEIVSGPNSALYGPNSANGVMHIITKSPFGSEGTTVSAGGGERVSFFGSLRHAGNLSKRFGYKISGQYYKGKDWENFDSQEPDSFGVAGKKVRAPGRDFRVEKFGGEARFDFRLNDDLTSIVTAGYSRVSDIELTGVGAMQTKDFTYGFLQGRLLYKNLFAQAAVNRIGAGASYWLRTGVPIVDQSRVYSGQAQHSISLGSRRRFTYGVDILQTHPESFGTIYGRNEPKDNITEIGAFLQSEITLSPKLNITGAIRVDDHNRMKDYAVSPRAALVYNLSANQNLRVTFNRAFSTPTANHLFLDLLSGSVPKTSYLVRGRGVPPESGFTFRRGGDGRPLMMSPLAPTAGFLPATVNSVWPALRQNLIAGSPANMRALLNSTLPAQLGITVHGDLRAFNPATGGFDLVEDVKNVTPLKPTMTNTFEVGYKRVLKERIFLTVEVYRTTVENFVGPLIIQTPNVFANAPQLTAALQPAAAAITNALVSQGLTPAQAQAQAAAIISGLVASAAQTPFGVISPKEIANANELILTYRNFGNISLTGADFNLTYTHNKNWKFSGNYSYVSKDFFPKNAAQLYDIALNAPKHKIGLSVQCGSLSNGLDAQLRGRYVEGFPVNSGVYIGAVQTYTVIDFDGGYDLADKTKFLFAVQNIFDRHYREFVGAPIVGRLVMARLSRSL
jgi:iron complex outermembrane receptor protein